jgi:hypothetical protein
VQICDLVLKFAKFSQAFHASNHSRVVVRKIAIYGIGLSIHAASVSLLGHLLDIYPQRGECASGQRGTVATGIPLQPLARRRSVIQVDRTNDR